MARVGASRAAGRGVVARRTFGTMIDTPVLVAVTESPCAWIDRLGTAPARVGLACVHEPLVRGTKLDVSGVVTSSLSRPSRLLARTSVGQTAALDLTVGAPGLSADAHRNSLHGRPESGLTPAEPLRPALGIVQSASFVDLGFATSPRRSLAV